MEHSTKMSASFTPLVDACRKCLYDPNFADDVPPTNKGRAPKERGEKRKTTHTQQCTEKTTAQQTKTGNAHTPVVLGGWMEKLLLIEV